MNFKLLFVVLTLSYVASPCNGQVGSSTYSADTPIPKEDLKNLYKDPTVYLKTTRPGQPIGLAFRLYQLEAEFREKIEEIKTQTSKSSKDQNEKIAIIRARERNLAQLLNETREEMVGLKTQNKDQERRIEQLEKKLSMLQNTPPASSALRGKNKGNMKNGASNNNGKDSKASIPPSSCEELAMLDYYLDGLYLVKNKETKKIHTVFCKFSVDSKVFQNVIGEIDVKTKSVHFYVQRNSNFRLEGTVLTFQLARVNEGNSFNLTSGIFTAPVSGIYQFQFSGIKSWEIKELSIFLQLNGNNLGEAFTSSSGSYDSLSLSASLRLVAGDKVNLFFRVGILEDSINGLTHFSGWLVEEFLN